ncbi:unnamed protein product, partial [Brassica oleracea var. botrytis]
EGRGSRGRRRIYFRNPDLTPDRDFHDHNRPKEPHIHSSSTLLRSSERDKHQIWNRGGANPQNTEKGRKKREGEERRERRKQRREGADRSRGGRRPPNEICN